MPITKEQRLARKNFIGSSDAAAILGADKYRNAMDVWLEKTGKVDDFEGNQDTERGNFLEPALIAFAEHVFEMTLQKNVNMISPERILAANLDAFMGLPDAKLRMQSPLGCPIEAKSTVVGEEWGEEQDQVPERVAIQCLHHEYCVGIECRVAFVPVILPGYRTFDFRMYRVDRDDEAIKLMVERLHEFWLRYVKEDREPPDLAPSIDVIKRVRRQPGSWVELDKNKAKVIEFYERATERRKAADEAVEEAQRNMLALLGTSEGARFPGGQLTYMLEGKDHPVTYTYRARRVPRIKRDK